MKELEWFKQKFFIYLIKYFIDKYNQEQYEFCYLALLDKIIDVSKILEYKNEKYYTIIY